MRNNKIIRSEVFRGVFFVFLVVFTVIAANNFDSVTEYISQATHTPAAFVIDTQASKGNLPRPWRNLAQGGESFSWRLEPISTMVKTLNPEYIRIDHIYDFYEIVQGSPGSLYFDFTKFDVILQDIRNVGATPFISLSYMPPNISSGNIVDKPLNYSDWQYIVQKTIEHVSGTMGFDNAYYEVWNEPDLFGDWKYYGDKNYLDLYAAAARGAAAAQNVSSFKIGGPSTTKPYKNWIQALAKLVAEQNLRLDFVSWHRYSTDINIFNRDVEDIRSWIREYPQLAESLEYHLTEWGHTSEMDSDYDDRNSAAHTVAAAISMVGNVNRSFIFEIQDGADPKGEAYWGRWGLFTANEQGNNPKIRYSGLKYLDSLSTEWLDLRGQGSRVKGLASITPEGQIQMVVANYDRRTKNQEIVPVIYQNVNPGRYLINIRYLSGKTSTIETATSGAQLKTALLMPANDVAFVELSPR